MQDKVNKLKEVMSKLKISFNDENILNTALTHSSYANEKKNVSYYERLEFLGDSVLQLCISEYLYKNYSHKLEGELTRARALIVCESSLFKLADKWSLGKYMNMSRGEELTGGRTRVSILADCVEAIIAAIYIDKGLESARYFIIENFMETIEKAINNEIVLDYKTKLQETMQQNGEVSIVYRVINEEGPPHRRQFFTEVIINDIIRGNGNGFSKKESEQNAAREALKIMEDIHE